LKKSTFAIAIGRGGHGSVQDDNWTETNWTVC